MTKKAKAEDVLTVDVHERMTLDSEKLRLTKDGRLVAHARIARTGIQLYRGSELGRDDLEVVRVYRPEEEVFDVDSLRTLAYIPVTDDHPGVNVTAANWRDHAVGFTGDEILRDGQFVRVPFMLADAKTIRKVKDGKRELSVGYSMDLRWESGYTADGQPYDAVQKNIRGNHLAVVAKARGGPMLKIGDETAGDDSQHNDGEDTMATQTLVIDGETFVVEDSSAGRIARFIDALKKRIDAYAEQLEKEKEDAKKSKDSAVTDAKTEAQKTIDELKAEVATLTKKLEDAEIKPEDLDARVADRQRTIEVASKIVGDSLKIDGQTTENIRRQVVTHVLGDEAKDWKDHQIEASFRTLAKDHKSADGRADPIRSTYMNGGVKVGDDYKAIADAHSDYQKGLTEAWKNGNNPASS